jgi:sarcosine oxidase subunit alpha
VLAGVPSTPVRETPMHAWHENHGARFVRTGDWLRPDSYGDPIAEVTAVRNRVGIMDVSALGKLDLRGPDVPAFLDIVYVNRWHSLPVGSVRYGVMVGEDGVVLDDGVTGRLEEQRFLMSTTSSGSERVRRWLEYWLQVERPDLRVWLTAMTDAYAAVNVAGPHARTLVARVAEGVDLSADAFPHMAVRPARVAGIGDCFMWRLGFTGDLSYEIYAPAGYGLHLWERLMEAGADLGIAPFGVEAQRTMRIEKGHAVVGQDTDALTGPFAAGLGRIVPAGKPQAIGGPELDWQREHVDELPVTLVGLQTVDGAIVPEESSQIVDGSTIIGRVTSSRFSPTLSRSVSLALLRPDRAAAGSTVTIRLPGGAHVPATVQSSTVHLDRAGERMRA